MKSHIIRAFAAAAIAVPLAAAIPAGIPAAASALATDPPCGYPSGLTPNEWTPVSAPPGAPLLTVEQMDSNPCNLVGIAGTVGTSSTYWRSADAGAHWTKQSGVPELTAVVTERLDPPTNAAAADLVLAEGPSPLATRPPTGVPAAQQLYISRNGGQRFQAAILAGGSQSLPVHGHILSAAAATRYLNGTPHAEIYIVSSATSPTGGVGVAPTAGNTVLKSSDGGATFTPVPIGGLRITSIDVNPRNPDEVWVNNTRVGPGGGGAWVSRDAGATWLPACCPGLAVNDIAIVTEGAAGITIYAASEQGILVSHDDGATWTTVTTGAAKAVRTAPDDAGVVLAISDGHVNLWRDLRTAPDVPAGLPADCAPSHLRRDGVVPATFLVTCSSGRPYRLLLEGYGHVDGSAGLPPGQPASPGVPGGPPSSYATSLPLRELATRQLPLANPQSGALAFDGRNLYYDDASGRIVSVAAKDGRYMGALAPQPPGNPVGLTVDLQHGQLLVSTYQGKRYAADLTSHEVRRLGDAKYQEGTTFDASFGGLSWVDAVSRSLWHDTLAVKPSAARTVCHLTSAGPIAVDRVDVNVSTWVADGTGGGYLQDEDDRTIVRMDARCNVVAPTYSHRQFAESLNENDAMACDSQTFFPQAAIWIRDSEPMTATAYGVPGGYCPMPSRLTITAPSDTTPGSRMSVCAVLRNATTNEAVGGRAVAVDVLGQPIGNAMTDQAGSVCLPYDVPSRSGLIVDIRAAFAGDASLYPSAATAATLISTSPVQAVTKVVGIPPAPPVTPIPPPGQPVLQPPLQAAAPAPAPNAAQAPQAQAQAQSQQGMQAAVVPQPQRQAQLALVTAANAVTTDVSGQHAMSALGTGRRVPTWPAPLVLGLGLVSCGVFSRVMRVEHGLARQARKEPR